MAELNNENQLFSPHTGNSTFASHKFGTNQNVHAQFTCASVDSRNNGNNTGVCAGSGSNPIASNFNSTIYATVPSTSKTGNITFKWANGTEPTAPPAISKVWINGALTATQIGPASPYNTGTAGFTKATYSNLSVPFEAI